MSLETTLLLIVLTLALVGASLFLSRRPRLPGQLPLVPHGFVQFVGLVFLLMLIGHLISLLTGAPWRGRF